MSRALKSLLLWLLIASLPLRGLTAVDMSCSPLHDGKASSGMSSHPQVNVQYHLNASEHLLDALAMSVSSHNPASPPEHSAHGQHMHKDLNSDSCAACYIGAAAPPLSIRWATESKGSQPLNPFPAISFTGFIPAGLERPPRHTHA